jgi:uncharacterized cysteine cluster protein YcgN (CxxCxxCC family)
MDKCKRCGKCCVVKFDIMGFIVPTKKVCPFLKYNEAEKKYYCEVYNERFQKAGWCHPIEDAIKEGSVSNNCGYVEGTDYKSKLNENININPEN